MHGRRFPAFLLMLALLPGCSGVGSSVVIDPDAVGSDQGTLISIGDIRTVAQEMIQSMSRSRSLARLRAEKKPLRILPGHFKQRTSIPIFDKQLFVNRLLSSLIESDQEGAYAFLSRESVDAERALQAGGAVLPAGGAPGTAAEPVAGADLVLIGEVRELLHREPAPGGGEIERRTVQYTLALDAVKDGSRMWIHAHEIVKQQVTGAVYR